MNSPIADTKKALAFLHGLAHLDPEQDVDVAILVQPYLAHSSAEVRCAALEQLASAAAPTLLHTIMDLAESDPDLAVRRQALLTLGAYIDEIDITLDMEAFDMLEEGDLTSDDLAEVADLLWSALEDEELDESLQQAALVAIASLDDDGVEEAITTAWEFDDTDWRVATLRAMGRSELTRWAPQVAEALQSPTREILLEAIWAAGQTVADAGLPRLIELVRTSSDKDLLTEVLHALGAFASLDAVKALTDFISASKSEELRESAWWAIEDIKEAILASRLEQNMNEQDFAQVEMQIEEEVEEIITARVPERLLKSRPALEEEEEGFFS